MSDVREEKTYLQRELSKGKRENVGWKKERGGL